MSSSGSININNSKVKEKGKANVNVNPNAPLWAYVQKGNRLAGGGGNYELKCNFCMFEFKGSYTRVKSHLLGQSGLGVKGCTGIDDKKLAEILRENDEAALKKDAQSKSSVPLPTQDFYHAKKRKVDGDLAKSFNHGARDTLDHLIARYFYANGVPFYHIRSPYFQDMIKFACGNNLKGYTPPSYDRMRTSLLEAEKASIEICLKSIKASWGSRGVSIVSDGWTDITRRPLINFIAASDAGPVFLRAIDTFGNIKNTDYMTQIFLEVVNEVGPSNVVQIITDNAAVCRAAGLRLQATHPHIFWTPCVVHTLNLALMNMCSFEREGKNATRYPHCQWMRELDRDVKMIRNFVVNHNYALTIYTKYAGLRLLGVPETRFAGTIIMVKRVREVKTSMCRMVVDTDWRFLREQDEEKAQKIKNILLDDEWWDRVDYFLEVMDPIVSMLRACDTDSSMLHLVYDMWDSMIEKVEHVVFQKEKKKLIDGDESEFFEEMRKNLIARWNKSSTPMHCMAHSLNPKYYSDEWLSEAPGRVPPHMDPEIADGRMSCLNRLFPNPLDLRKVSEEFGMFSGATGYYGGWQPMSERYTVSAKSWWNVHGARAPMLARLANRSEILFLTLLSCLK